MLIPATCIEFCSFLINVISLLPYGFLGRLLIMFLTSKQHCRLGYGSISLFELAKPGIPCTLPFSNSTLPKECADPVVAKFGAGFHV